VFDARTHRPITGVHVAVDEHPSASTTTDAGGAYRIQAQRNYHVLWAWFIMGDSYPSGEYWYPNLNFSHPGYRPVRWRGTFNEDAAEKAKNKPRPMNVWLDHTDVFLKPQ
jgi:hypothetical protein